MAFASYLYGSPSGFDGAYDKFCNHVPGKVNLDNLEHLGHLFTFLRQWGCRQFTKEGQDQAKVLIAKWFREYERCLPEWSTDIWTLPDDKLKTTSEAYGSLVLLKAGKKKNGQRPGVGATGAAKILFVLRPKSLMAWDDAITEYLGLGKDAGSYGKFLRDVQCMVDDFRKECEKHGISLKQVPAELGHAPHMTVPKLIDEYLWLTLSQKRSLPDPRVLGDWKNWANAILQARQAK